MSAYTDTLNKRNRMTQAERDADILREVFGPLLARVFPALPVPEAPAPMDESTEESA